MQIAQFFQIHWRSALLEIAAGVLIALLLRKFVCLMAYVKGRSMENTLHNGEIIFALRPFVHRNIRRFDVVLCRYPGRRQLFVKRVVALSGERVSIQDDILYINGEATPENFPRRACMRPMAEQLVPPNACFVLGDNRPCSRDSRAVGPIPQDKIVAVVKCVVFPFNKIRKIS